MAGGVSGWKMSRRGKWKDEWCGERDGKKITSESMDD